jgi:uncharacterized BrkB/YihY/UPF0761 family membrane protein
MPTKNKSTDKVSRKTKRYFEDDERPPPRAKYVPPTRYSREDSPTVKGLLYMLIAGVLVLIGGFVCGVISIIGYILALVGFFKIYSDKEAFPEPHPNNMRQSLIFYILGIIVIIIGIVVVVISAFILVMAVGEDTSISEAFDVFIFYLLIGIIISLIGGILWVFGRYKLLYSLMPEDKKSLLNIAMVIVILSMILGMIVLSILFNNMKGAFEDVDEEEKLTEKNLQKYLTKFQTEAISFTLLSGVLSIISEILFIICFYFAYDYQKQNPQLRTGGRPYMPEEPYPPPVRK